MQLYEVRSPTGETFIARRRFVTTLGVAGYELVDKADDPSAPSLQFRARLRYDADYGGATGETEADNLDRLVPGFARGPVDLMYGYVEGRRFLRGLLGFRLGRQYVTDALGWWSFDGAMVKITTPYSFAVEAYGGLEQRAGMPLSTPRFERDGIWRGDRTGYDPLAWPSFQPAEIAPAYGAALETAGFTWLHGRLTYRRVYNTGASNVASFASGAGQSAPSAPSSFAGAPTRYDETRISQERLGYAIDGTLPELGGVKAGLAYDLYARRLSNVFASVDGYVSKRITVSADYDYFVPTFDADSIWNFFLAMPMNDLGLRASWEATDRLGISGGLRGRAFQLQTQGESLKEPTSPAGLSRANYYPSSALDPMAGTNLAARYRFGEGSLGARGAADVARSGDRVGVDLFGERTLETRYVLSARAGVWQWNDKLRDDRDAVSFGYVAGVGYKLFSRSLALAEFEHNANRLVGQRFRVMLWLTVAVTR